jgi:sulfite reductase beta subunit-like hemoprotein
MAPAELRQMNISRFQGLLLTEIDPNKLAMIQRLLDAERLKADSAYPPGAATTSRGA